MKSKNIPYILILITLLHIELMSINQVNFHSPDNNIQVSFSIKEKLEPFPPGQRFYYSVSFYGKEIISDSPLGIEFQNLPPIAQNLKIISSETKSTNETWERIWGKRKKVIDNYNEMHIELQEELEPQRKINLIFRAFNDGVAFRYALPRQPNLKDFKLTSERTWFHFIRNYDVWAANYGGFYSHQEAEFDKIKISDIGCSEIIGLPLLVRIEQKIWLALTEANLTDWAGMYLTKAASGFNALCTTLSPRFDQPDALVDSSSPRSSPWRVIMLGKAPGALIESDIISNLNEPCALEDVSWIKPGKCAWDWWWCNRYIPDAKFEVGSNTETMKYFIDFAAEMGWQYQLVDWHWYGPPFVETEERWDNPNPDADITKSTSKIDIPELVQYARQKGVRLFLWLEWTQADRQMNQAFPLYEKWGIAGVKVDFMQRDDQEVVNFYHKLVKLAAKHHLLVDFHGAYKPTGFSRTYPNLITREGVLGNEYSKWSTRVTPQHTVTLPFTRGLLGSMDFTPVAFVNVTKDDFRTEEESPTPMVMGTRCHQLAMLVVYESALQVLCDSPYNYRKSPAGLNFLKMVPTTWDDTKVIHGRVGEYITIARRSGDDWFIGSMTNWDERELSIPLDFLGDGKYTAHIWQDAPDANMYPQKLTEREIEVNKSTSLAAKLAPGGGQVMHIYNISRSDQSR